MTRIFKKYFMEFIGAFYLMLTIGMSVLYGIQGVIPAIAIGAALMIMVYAGGYISGGHYNPAVSLAAAIRGSLSWRHIVQYWIAQVGGAVCATLIVKMVANELFPVLPTELNNMTVFICEFLFTTALAFVVLQTATTFANRNNSYYGLAIGSTLMVGIFAVGSLCAAAFNPAIAISLGMLGLINWTTVCFTILANLLGGLVAAILFFATSKDTTNE